VVSAAPPCPPWSRIEGGQDTGRGSTEGKKFELAINFISEIENKLGTKARILIENVVFKDHLAVEPFEKMCGGRATVCDATDFGVIRRPRLWWTRADMSDENLGSLPHPFNKMKMGRYNEFRKIVPNVPFDTFKPDVIDGTTWSLPGPVESRTKRLPCLTTPALWSDGREEPKRSGKQASATAKKRWAEDNRKYGPWAYETDAMLHDDKNNLRHVTADEAERLHHFPSGWTSSTNADENTRLRLIGNAWHAGVAKLMWIIVLLCPTLPNAATTFTYNHEWLEDPQGCKHHGVYGNTDLCTPPLREQRELHSEAQHIKIWQDRLTRSPKLRPIEEAISWFRASGTLPGPWPQDRCTIAVYEQDDPMRHLQQAIKASHPDSRRRHLDPSIGFALSAQRMLRHRIIEYRSQIAADINLLVEQMADETEAWKSTLQPHVLAAYSHKDAPNGVTQIPVLLQIMEWMQLPDVEVWRKELTSGFKMMGKLTPGLGWKKRTDSHYANPMSMDEFRSRNKANILKCIRRKPDADSNSMLKEITDEVDKGRMSGPYKAPPFWNAKTVAPDGRKLLPLPVDEVFIANAFAIHQIGSDDKTKVRRGEDWRRSFHNSTVEVDDAPYHHNIESYAALATANLETWSDGERPALKIWGQDHEGAYRQLPLENTREAFVHLMTDRGPTLWAHNVLLFGAVGSVWAYNRFGDIMCLLARILAWIPALHYVDDFGSIEREETADSAFDTFEGMNASLGLVMKKSKSQPPMQEHKMQGVIVKLDTKLTHPMAIVRTAPSRKERLLHTLNECLLSDQCSPSLAASLGGKLTFVSTSSFGRAGRAAVKAIYARQHAEHDHRRLTQGLRCSMKALCNLLESEVPRQISLTCDDKVKSIVYADAFFRLGDTKWKATDIPRSVLDYPDELLQNGWGCVLVNEHETQFMEGQFPPHLLRKFCNRKAFIYFLEIWAQILPMIVWWRQLDQYVLSFVDNEASKHALTKGYGNEPAVDNLIGAYWSMCSNKKKSPWFERVSSKANISDDVSRGDFTRATRLGWRRVFPRLSAIENIMEKIADNAEYAFSAAAADMTELH